MKPVSRSAPAEADIQAALEYYLAEAPNVAEGFIAALEKAVAQIERQPGIGSPRDGHELGIPMLRHWSLNRFPYLVFYIEHDDHSDLIRLVHMSRDIPASLA
jgi:toxin ParE1/3/4